MYNKKEKWQSVYLENSLIVIIHRHAKYGFQYKAIHQNGYTRHLRKIRMFIKVFFIILAILETSKPKMSHLHYIFVTIIFGGDKTTYFSLLNGNLH